MVKLRTIEIVPPNAEIANHTNVRTIMAVWSASVGKRPCRSGPLDI